MISTCAATVLVNSPSNSAYYSFPSSIDHTNTLQISGSLLSYIEVHHIINTFLFILCVGFLSWSLDSHHQEIDEVVIEKIQEIKIQAISTITSTVNNATDTISSSSSTTTDVSYEEQSITEITTPSSSIRSSFSRSTPSRRNTIENIARLLEVEDRKRQELRRTFSNTSYKAEISPKAIEFGIDGVDVDVNWAPISSIDTEVVLLKEINKELEKVQISSASSPTTTSPIIPTHSFATIVESNTPKDKDEIVVEQREIIQGEKTEELLSEVEIAERRSRSWKTRTLVRLRIPIQWVL